MVEGRTSLKSEQTEEKRYKGDESQTGWPCILFVGGSERLLPRGSSQAKM